MSELPIHIEHPSAEEVQLSIIVPIFNEAESIPTLYRELKATLDPLGKPYELLMVDDGSTDGSNKLLTDLAAQDARLRLLVLRRNYGQTAAMSAGIDHARGEILIPIDADLQNDPADIPKLINKLDEGYDVVSGWRADRQDKGLTRVLPSMIANKLISWFSGVKLHDYGCTLKAYRKEVLDGVRLYGEMHRFIPIYAHMHGGKVTELAVNHRARKFGKSKYGLERIFKVLLDLILVKFLASYTAKPMYVFGGFGLICLLLSLFPIGLAVFYKLMPKEWGQTWHKDFVETPLPVIAVAMVLVGFLALLQGILAEMLMRTYFESQGKRPYLLREAKVKN